MKFIRRVVAAFTLWAVAMCVWAAVSHLTNLPGPAKASTATLERVANFVERADAPASLRVPGFAAAQLRRTAHTAGRINGGIERAIGAWLDRLGHGAAHGRGSDIESVVLVAEPAADVADTDKRRVTIRVDARSGRADARLRNLRALGLTMPSPPSSQHAGVWIDRTVKAPDGSFEADLRLHVARHGETFSLKAAEAGSSLNEAVIELDVDASLDRDKLRERLEKLLDLLEDLNNVEGGR